MQSSYDEIKKPRKKVLGEKLKYFFKETFRPHSKEEYAEVFTRGLSGNSEGVARKLPWLYLRVFALNLILFAILAFSFRIASYTVDYVTAIVFGGLLFNIPLFILFFELYPKRDLSLVKLFGVLAVGGVISTVVIIIGYEYIYSTHDEANAWISTLWVGFWEEFIKGAVAIAAVFVLRKRNPLYCFLIGFAVGTGYSYCEDLGYIYSLSYSDGTVWLVLTAVGRGLSCVCSHAPWTAMICWAFAKFKKPFINFRFYGVVIAMMALHYFADVPFFDENLNILGGVTLGWAIEAAVVISIFVMVFFALRSSFKEIYAEGKPDYPQAQVLTKSAKISQAANITAVLCASLLSVFAFAGCGVKLEKTRVYDYIYDDNQFVELMQDGLTFNFNTEREFDGEGEIYSQFVSQGNPVGVTQKVYDEESGYDYFYVYRYEDGVPALQSIGVNVNSTLYYLRQLIVYDGYAYVYYGYPTSYQPVDSNFDTVVDEEEDDASGEDGDNGESDGDEGEDVEDGDNADGGEGGEDEKEPIELPKPVKVVNYFSISGKNFSYSYKEGYYKFSTDKIETSDYGSIIALAVLAGATLVGGSAAFITLKIKARRQKDA